LTYTTVEEFLADIKKQFGRGNDKIIKVAKLKKVKQRSGTMKEFV